MTEQHYITWADIAERVDAIVDHMRLESTDALPVKIYGVPRGGCVPAVMLAERLNALVVDHPDQADTIVDDLIDSGATAARFDGKRFVALYRKPHSPIGAGGAQSIDGWLVFPWELETADAAGPADAVIRLLEHVGEDPTREGLVDTPARVLRSLSEMTSGYDLDPADILARRFTEACDEMVVVDGIEFVSLCEHHMLPFVGQAVVGYLPDKHVVGLSKIPRLVECFARRLQVQERLTNQIASALMTHAEPLGVGVVLRAHHSCMSCRGVRKATAQMVTSSMLGALRDKPEARAEFLALAGVGRR